MTLKQIETAAIASALRKCRGEQKAAAEMLGVSRRVLNYKMRKLGFRPTDLGERKPYKKAAA